MTRSLKRAAGIAALLAATFGVIEVASAHRASPPAPAAVSSDPAPDEGRSSALPLEQD